MPNLLPANLRAAPTREIGTSSNIVYGGALFDSSWNHWIQEGENVPELQWPLRNRWFEEMLFGDSMVNQMWLSLVMPLSEYVWAINPNGADADYTKALAADLGLPVGLPTQEEEDEYLIEPGLHSFNFLQHAEEAFLAIPFGHYPFEKYGPVAVDGDGLWHLAKLAARHPATIMELDVADTGELRNVRQYVGRGQGVAGMPEPIPAEKLVNYVWRGDARARHIGRPMLRPIYRNWLIRDVLIRVDAINHEKAGGVPTIETDDTFAGTDLSDLQALAVNFRVGEDSGAALPPGAKLVLKAMGGSDVVRSLEYHDNQIAGQWRSMVEQLGQTATGNRALGQTFAGLQDIAQRAIARWFSAAFREQVIRYWWDLNVPRKPDGTLPPHPLLAWRVPLGSATDPIAPAAPPLMQREGATPVPGQAAPTAPAGPAAPVAARGRPPDPTVPTAPGEGAGRNGASSPSEDRRSGRGGVGGRGVGAGEDARAARPGASAEAAQAVDSPRFGQVVPMGVSGPPEGGDPSGRQGSTGPGGVGTPPSPPLSFPGQFRRDLYPHEVAAKTDFAGLALRHDSADTEALALLQNVWLPDLQQRAHDAIVALGDDPSPADLANLALDVPDSAPLHDILLRAAKTAADDAGAELAAQGLDVKEAADAALAAAIRGQADAMAQQVASGIRLAAGRKAVQVGGPTSRASATDVAGQVHDYLNGLAHVWEKDQMGGAVSQAVNGGRFARFDLVTAPATYYASEILDNSTCDACASIDGNEYATLGDAMQDYPGGGFTDCAGGPRCRGTVVTVAGSEI